MSLNKQLIINRFILPTEITGIIREYAFLKIKKIPKNDIRYNLLLTVPKKFEQEEYYFGSTISARLRMYDYKDFSIVYNNFRILFRTTIYDDQGRDVLIDTDTFLIE